MQLTIGTIRWYLAKRHTYAPEVAEPRWGEQAESDGEVDVVSALYAVEYAALVELRSSSGVADEETIDGEQRHVVFCFHAEGTRTTNLSSPTFVLSIPSTCDVWRISSAKKKTRPTPASPSPPAPVAAACFCLLGSAIFGLHFPFQFRLKLVYLICYCKVWFQLSNM